MSPDSSSSSSGEEDGDAEWLAAIDSVAGGFTSSASNGAAQEKSYQKVANEDDGAEKPQPRAFKLYQIKAKEMLDDLLEKSLELVKVPILSAEVSSEEDDEGVQLFRQAPRGIIFDHIDEIQGPTKKPRIVPIEEIREKSKKFRRRLRSVTVDGCDIIAAAENACKKSLARYEAKSLEAKAKAKKEEERVAGLKRARGEKWLPSVKRRMQSEINAFKRAKAVGVVL